MKRILLVGDGNHVFVRYLVRWLKQESVDEIIIDVLSTNNKIDNDNMYDSIYLPKNNTFYTNNRKINILWFNLALFFEFKKIYKQYDYINFHFITADLSWLFKLKLKCTTIVSFWGSDFYKANIKSKKIIHEIINKANIATCTNPQMGNDIIKEFKNLNKDIKKATFGLEPLEYLKKNTLSPSESKNLLNIDKSKIVVSIGYNKSPNQQHIKILENIETSLTQKQKQKIIIVLPLTYNGNLKYEEQIKSFMKDYPIENKLMFKFMTNQEVAILLNATDIFIQLQKTDQFSGSMQEHMYANNIVITGSWLPYKILEENDVYFRTVDSLENIGKDLSYCIDNLEKEVLQFGSNKEKIYELSGWPNVIVQWLKLFNLNS